MSRARRAGRRVGGRSPLAFLTVPLAAMHLAMLASRAVRPEEIDPLALTRWILALVALVFLRRAKKQVASAQRPTAVIGAILIFALIHAPAVAPDPSLPLAATGVGLSASLAFLPHRSRSEGAPDGSAVFVTAWDSRTESGNVPEALKGRAPPAWA